MDGPLRRWAGRRLHSLVYGSTRVYAELDEGWCGVSLAPRWPGAPRGLPGPVEPWGSTPRSLARMLDREPSPATAAAAVAAVNAATTAWLAHTPWSGVRVVRRGESLAKLLGVEKGDRVVLLGYMPPLAEQLALEAGGSDRVTVVELDPELAGEARSRGYRVMLGHGEEVMQALREASVAVWSGSAVLEPGILLEEVEAAASARVRALVGPTSSFHPLVSRRLGMTHQAGLYIEPRLCPRLRAAVSSGVGVHRGLRGARLVEVLWRL